jgi:protein phosphatase
VFVLKEISSIIKEALKANSTAFVQLVDSVVSLMAEEAKQTERTELLGKLVKVKPVGKAAIVGDIHGDLESLMHILEESRFLELAEKGENVLLIFLGDYGDRGDYSVEVYYTVLTLKQLFPANVLLLRGNHEGPEDILAYPHDLPMQLRMRFGKDGLKVYERVRELFSSFYNAALVEKQYIIIHGGVPSQARGIEDLAYAHEKHPRESHLEEMLWSDPVENLKGVYASPRGAGKLFGVDVTERFLKMLDVKVFIRGHEPCENGFKTNHNGKILTLFSRKGMPYLNEQGAYLYMDLFLETETADDLKSFIRLF